MDPYVALGGDGLAWEDDAKPRRRRGHEVAEPLAGGVLRHTVKLTALEVPDQRRQHAGRDHDIQHKPGGLFLPRAPFPGLAFQGRIASLQVGFRHNAENVVRVAVSLVHPGQDVFALGDLPLMHMWRVAEGVQLRGDPMRPVTVGAGVADEDVEHAAASRLDASSHTHTVAHFVLPSNGWDGQKAALARPNLRPTSPAAHAAPRRWCRRPARPAPRQSEPPALL